MPIRPENKKLYPKNWKQIREKSGKGRRTNVNGVKLKMAQLDFVTKVGYLGQVKILTISIFMLQNQELK